MNAIFPKYLSFALMLFFLVPAGRVRSGSDWTDWRGPARDGVFGPGAGTVAGGTAGPFGNSTNGSSYGFQVEAWW